MIKPALFQELQDLCHRSFPERLAQRISQVEPLAAGRHPTLALSLSWMEGRRPRVERLVLRRYTDAWTWWALRDEHKAQREWTLMRWLYVQGMPVPNLYAIGAEGGTPFLLMARMSGTAGTSLLGEGPAQRALASCLDALADQLVQLHQLVPPGPVREALPQIILSEELARIDEIARQSSEEGLIEAVEELLTCEIEVRPPCVLHGNPQLANLLYDARGLTALLDWENGALGDPRWDVARVLNGLGSDRENVLAGRFCRAYADRAGFALTELSTWRALAAVQQWAMASWACENAVPVESADPGSSHPACEVLRAQIGTWREQAWRALVHLRHERDERPVEMDGRNQAFSQEPNE
jgi:aminoglycoside phosphotransferase (APT) family kinase protein